MSQGESSNPRPGQPVFLRGEGNPHPNGKTGKRRTIYPAGLRRGRGSGIGIGRSSEGAEHLVPVGQGGGDVEYELARAEGG